MATLAHGQAADTTRRLRTQEEVEAHIRAICFKTGPPNLVGAELEWTVHHTGTPSAPLDAAIMRQALGRHTPALLDPGRPPDPLPSGALLTIEPGGQLEISSAPAHSLADLHAAVTTDLGHLTDLLGAAGLTLGEHGLDPHREPRRLLDTPRYAAMERAYDVRGPHGRTMMCSTAGLQVCLDAGEPGELPLRWAAVQALGPPLIATFATSATAAHASARMATWWGMDPRITHPLTGPPDDPAAAWVRYALAAPLTCVRRDDGRWDPPPGATLADWLAGALPEPPTADDVEYHLSTLFPPVRPRGYLEVRYLDAQPGADWIVPVAMLIALLADRATTEAALELARPVAGRWVPAHRAGLADRPLRRAAAGLAALAAGRLAATGLAAPVTEHVIDTVDRRLGAAEETS